MSSGRLRASRPSSPDSIPRYEPVLELGRGGMGQVLLSRALGAEGFERLVALKRMNLTLEASEELIRRFRDEARIAAQVRHANVVSVHHFGRDEHGLYIVADYVEGVSLQTLVERALEQGIRPAPEIVLRVIADALAGLHAAHETTDALGRWLGILHRDVSAHNVLVGKDGVARITDFGVAKSALNTQQTAKNRLVGKLLYMPPEYLQQEPIDRRLDVYAMGVTMWVALAGLEPWAELDDAALVSKILSEELPPLASTGATIAPELEAIVHKACAKNPEDRYATAGEMAAAIHRLARATGWMALHDEVASFVEQMCGEELLRVRDAIARLSWPPHARRSSSVPPESAQRWSGVGVQRIRVVERNPDDGMAATEADLSLAPLVQQTSGVRPRASPPPPAGRDPELARRERTHAIAALALLLFGVAALIAALFVVLG